MAIGTITVGNRVGETVTDPTFHVAMSFAGDTSYPTGGTADFTASVVAAVKAANAAKSDANVRGRENLTVLYVIDNDCGQYVPFFDATNDKLKVLDGGSATRAEVANEEALNGTTFNVIVVCK